MTDEIKIKQVLNNLIGNAVKFTNEGKIQFGYEVQRKFLEFFVKDTGIGIAPSDQRLIFDRFRQVEVGISRTYGGTGLGLSICRGLVKLLGGEIWLESSPDSGTSFFFSIPYVTSTSDNRDKAKRGNEAHYNWTGKTILIVEDEISNQLLLKEYLVATGANMLFASNGKEALSIYKQADRIDLLLIDIKMPVMDGEEFIRQIRAQNITVPAIAQTAYAFNISQEQLHQTGFNEYITKPLNRAQLLITINKLLG
jgi:CheY-like chemotaxis protein